MASKRCIECFNFLRKGMPGILNAADLILTIEKRAKPTENMFSFFTARRYASAAYAVVMTCLSHARPSACLLHVGDTKTAIRQIQKNEVRLPRSPGL